MIKTYSELITLPSFIDRYKYLRLHGKIGEETFGYKRRINQEFYHSDRWLRFRDEVIIRDNGCDLALDGYEILRYKEDKFKDGAIIIHHLNPITFDDIVNQRNTIFDFENVVCTKLSTHNAIHYGDETLLIVPPIDRSKNDTCPWRRK